MGWSGDVALGNAGTTAQAFKDAVATRINWFRAMAGVPTGITLDPTYSAQDQQAAMISVNRQISHTTSRQLDQLQCGRCHGRGDSNICLGYTSDPGCVLAYIVDQGSNNAAAGHRRWVLYPQTQVMGTGDVPQSGGGSNPYPPANALWVFDGNLRGTRAGHPGYLRGLAASGIRSVSSGRPALVLFLSQCEFLRRHGFHATKRRPGSGAARDRRHRLWREHPGLGAG